MIVAVERRITRQHIGLLELNPAPCAPPGDGWRLEAASAVTHHDGGYTMFYFWAREPRPSEPCSWCGAMARKPLPQRPSHVACLNCGKVVVILEALP